MLMQESTVPMAFLRARPIGIMPMLDQECVSLASASTCVRMHKSCGLLVARCACCWAPLATNAEDHSLVVAKET